MDWNRISNRLMRRTDQRARGLRARIRVHMKLLRQREKALGLERVVLVREVPPVWETRQWSMMRHALAQGHKIIAFDAEWQYNYPNALTEIGVAIYHRGEREVHNIRVRGGAGKADKTTRFMSEKQAKDWLARTFAGAGLLVGHAIKNDRAKMKEFGWPLPGREVLPCVDTEGWSKLLNPEQNNPQKLTNFCRRHGVELLKAHIAGNDACMTLDVALCLAAIRKDEINDRAA